MSNDGNRIGKTNPVISDPKSTLTNCPHLTYHKRQFLALKGLGDECQANRHRSADDPGAGTSQEAENDREENMLRALLLVAAIVAPTFTAAAQSGGCEKFCREKRCATVQPTSMNFCMQKCVPNCEMINQKKKGK